MGYHPKIKKIIELNDHFQLPSLITRRQLGLGSYLDVDYHGDHREVEWGYTWNT